MERLDSKLKKELINNLGTTMTTLSMGQSKHQTPVKPYEDTTGGGSPSLLPLGGGGMPN